MLKITGKTKLTFFALFVFAFTFSSCISVKAPEYKSIKNFDILQINPTAKYRLDLEFYNPNPIGAKMKKLDVTVKVFGSELNQSVAMTGEKAVKIKPQESFIIPLNGETNYGEVNKILAAGISSLFGGKTSVPVHVEGSAVIKKFIFRKRVPFSFDENIDLKKIKLPTK